MTFKDYEENWKNSEIASNFIDIYEAQKAKALDEETLFTEAELEETNKLEIAMSKMAEKRYYENYIRVKAEVELVEIKDSLNKLASAAVEAGNLSAALLIESTISDLNISEVSDV